MKFEGQGRPLSHEGLTRICDTLGCDRPTVWAVLSVETSGFGFLQDRRPQILFERHIFHGLTGGRFDRGHEDISHPTRGGYLFGLREYARLERAQLLQWQFFEQYDHEPHVAVARFWVHYRGGSVDPAALAERRAGGYRALDAMEKHLAGRQFLVGERYSLADISLYAYTHVAGEGGFELQRYPAIRAWLDRVASQPGHVPIDA